MPSPPPRVPNRWLPAAGLIMAAGVLLALAAILRWAPCFAGNRPVCLVRQSHRFGYVVPVDPWQPLPGVTLLAGVGMILVGVAWLLLFARLRIKPWQRTLITIALVTKPALFGLLTLVSAITGTTWTALGPTLLTVEVVLDLVALVFLIAHPEYPREDYRRAILAVLAFLAVGQIPAILEFVVLALGRDIADTPPGAGLLAAGAILACGIGIAVITRRAERTRSPTLAARNALERPADR
jgi:hypothetical protein